MGWDKIHKCNLPELELVSDSVKDEKNGTVWVCETCKRVWKIDKWDETVYETYEVRELFLFRAMRQRPIGRKTHHEWKLLTDQKPRLESQLSLEKEFGDF